MEKARLLHRASPHPQSDDEAGRLAELLAARVLEELAAAPAE